MARLPVITTIDTLIDNALRLNLKPESIHLGLTTLHWLKKDLAVYANAAAVTTKYPPGRVKGVYRGYFLMLDTKLEPGVVKIKGDESLSLILKRLCEAQ